MASPATGRNEAVLEPRRSSRDNRPPSRYVGAMGTRTSRPTLDISQALGPVTADLQANRAEQALVGLLAIWAESRAPEIAALIEDLSERLSSAYPPLPNGTRRELDEAWTARLRAGDPVERGLLLERALEGAGPDLCRRMELLAALPPDPRIASTLLRAVLHWKASPQSKAWTAMHRVLRAHADPRTLTALEQPNRAWDDHYPDWRHRGGEGRTLSMVRKALAKKSLVLSSADRAAVSALAELIEHRSGADHGSLLLTKLRADPDDLDRRRVYADWLTQRADPRGEFISLQLLELDGDPSANSPAVRRRIAALRSAHEGEWLGRLASCFCEKSVRFVGGFPVSARVRPKLRNPGMFVDAPEWATFRSLVGAPAAILRSSTLGALTEIRVEVHQAIRLLEARVPIPRVRRLVVDAPTRRFGLAAPPAIWRARERRGLPELRELSVVHDGPIIQRDAGFLEWENRFAGPMPHGLELIELAQVEGPLQVARWVQALRNARCRTISRLRLRLRPDLLFDMEREGDEWSRVRTYRTLDGAASNLQMLELAELAQLGCEVQVDERRATGSELT
jgi:uncharacterized protein (TIGR02996 family)